MNNAFGIDLGTTFSCIATFDAEYGKTEVLKNREGKSTTPSVVYVESDMSVVVGDQALAQYRGENAKKVVAFAKRMLADDDVCVRGDFGYPTSRGKPLTPITVSAHILSKLATENPAVRNIVGAECPNVVITHPAYFSASAKERTIQAGKAAGLNVIGTIEEPVAAAMSYGFNEKAKNKMVMVYDLGGGTFDVTIIKFDAEGNGIVLAKDGDHLLGGVDWDNAFGYYIWKRYDELCPQKIALVEQDFKNPSADIEKLRKVNKFRKIAQEAKHALSESDVYDIECDDEGTCLQVSIRDFDEVTSACLGQTFDIVDHVLESVVANEIDSVLLVGGSTRMRQVWSSLEKTYPSFKGKLRLEDPDEAVAKGAAIFAAQIMARGIVKKYEGGTEVVVYQDPEVVPDGHIGGIGPHFANIAPRSYGVETLNMSTNALYISNIILKDDPLPAARTQVYRTVEDGQTEMKIEVYESEIKKANLELDEGRKITKVEQCVRFDKPVPKETPVNITFRLNGAGVLSVDAKSQVDNGAVSFVLELEGTLNQRGLAEAVWQVSGVAKR